MRSLAAIALFGAMAASSSSAAAGGSQNQELLYVCIQDDAKIAVVDMGAREVDRIIDLTTMGFAPTAKPHFVVVEPDGSNWYVSLIGENRILKFNRQDEIVGFFEMEAPGMMALAGDSHLVASRSMSAVNPPSRIGLVERVTMEGEEVEVMFPRPHPMVVGDGFAYTGSLGVNQLATVSIADARAAITDIPGPMHSLVQFAISPDGATLVGSGDLSGQLLIFTLADPAAPRFMRAIDVGRMAFDPTFSHDGRWLWVPVKSSNDIAVFNTSTWAETTRIRSEAFRQPHQVIFSADGSTAFVTTNNKPMSSNEGGPASLVIVDVPSGQVATSIELGRNLTGMGTRPHR